MILVRYIEMTSTTGRALSVVKMHNNNRSKNVHALAIGANGVTVGLPLEESPECCAESRYGPPPLPKSSRRAIDCGAAPTGWAPLTVCAKSSGTVQA